MLAGRYRLLTRVGRGGMGTVWHARDEVLDRDVAVKEVLVHPGLGDAERDVLQERTKREARATARLSHPSVVTVYDVVEEDGRPWIIMELIRARSLDQVIKKDGPLPWRRAAEVGRQLLSALSAAHEAGVLHRDVKPSNVLLAAGERAVLTDFGIATSAGDATLTTTGLVMGSPAYLAPERARGHPVGPASDLWSLGVTLYAMVDGKSPFERTEPMASLVAVISDDPVRTASAGPLWPLIEGLLHKDPDQRMTPLEAGLVIDRLLRGDLEEAGGTLPVPIPPPRSVLADQPTRERPADLSGHPAGPAEATTDPADAPAGPTDAVMAQHLGEPTVRSAARPAQGRLLWTGVALVAALALGGLVVALNWQHGGEKPVSAPGSPKTSAGTPTSATATAKPSAATLVGFRTYKDSTGYSIAVPKSWAGPQHKNGGDFFYSPDHNTYVQIDQTSHPDPSALKDWQDQEPSVAGRFAGYHRLRLDPVAQGAPVADSSGKKASDWEYTWQAGTGKKHVLSRGFIMNGHGYAIVISAPDGEWEKTRTELAPVFDHFVPASPP
ncbi:MAG: serine/threonine protein kinase [Actinomycetia bacterium]|nr:serine/threonine protein kinase [Actinomycetes bacterium]